jgi:hypothetical protein
VEDHTASIFSIKESATLVAVFLHSLFFIPEDGGSMFLQYAGKLLADYMVAHPRI